MATTASRSPLARALSAVGARRGANATPFMPAISGPGGVPQIVCGPHDRLLEEGDILFIDTGSNFDGYFCDFDRNYAVGRISSEAARVHDALWLATEASIATAVPGATINDVWRAMSRIIEDAGAIGNNVGRLGHGLGLQLTEPPSHRLGDGTVIVENMVLTIEPGMECAPCKTIVHEENIAVTENGQARQAQAEESSAIDAAAVARPGLEVADIFREHDGTASRRANAGHLSLGQLKAMSAIERCGARRPCSAL